MSDIGPVHLVDPELRDALDETFPVMSREELLGLRAGMPRSVRQKTEELAELFIPGPAGAPEVRILVYRPFAATSRLPCYLHIHGGAFMVGTPDVCVMGCANLASELNCVVVSIDYRLAPEAPFPAAIEDCYATLLWLHREASALGIDRDCIAVGGEEAGAGLAAALTLLARDRGEVDIHFQLLEGPMLDDRTSSRADLNPFTGHYFWRPEENRVAWEALLGEPPGGGNVSPYAAPARAENLYGLPPAFIAVGALDLFLEESLEYARRLTRAGTAVELHVYPGAFRGFEMVPGAQVTKMARANRLTALHRVLHRR